MAGPTIEETVSMLAWVLVLKNKPSITITALIGEESIEMELKLKNPEQLAVLTNAMSGKP
jgi:hypothetical protein